MKRLTTFLKSLCQVRHLRRNLLLSCLLFPLISKGQTVTIPDANFKAYLVGNTAINTNLDGEIQTSEAAAFTGTIDAVNLDIVDLTGIEAFTALTVLNVGQNDLTSLNLSANVALEEVHLFANRIVTLDFSGNPALRIVNANSNVVTTSVDVTQNPALEMLRLSTCSLSTIDLTQNTTLTHLYVNGNNLSGLNVSQNTALIELDCGDNDLNSLDLSTNNSLVLLRAAGNTISALNLGSSTVLDEVFIENNQLGTLDISQIPSVRALSAGENPFTTLDLTQNIDLEELTLEENNLNILDLSQNSSLAFLSMSDVPLTSLEFSTLTSLTAMEIYESQITAMDLSENSLLQELILGDNPLLTLNLANGNNTNMTVELQNQPNLECVQVDDVTFSTANWTDVDVGVSFSLDCPDPFVTTWKTDNPGTSSDNQITIPIFASASTGYTIDWGDGNVTTTVMNNQTHTYAVPGTYTVQILGDLQALSFNNGGDKEKLLSIEQWGDISWTRMDRAFRGCTNLVVNATDAPDLSNVTTMQMMFFAAESFNQPVNHWDVSNVQNMSFLFTGARDFNQPLDNWDVSNVTDMQSMFSTATDFDQPLNGWEMSNVTNISNMFSQADAFNQPLDSWDVSNVQFMVSVFAGNDSFNQPLEAWDVSMVTNMTRMFQTATSFDQPLGDWNVGNVTTMQDMLNNASSMSADNYDDLLTGWSDLTLQNNVFFGASGVRYCDGGAARQTIIDNFSWSISDGGQNCPPEIVSLSPVNGETGVAPDANLMATFDPGEILSANSGNIEIRRIGDDQLVEAFDVSASEVTVSGNTLTINPSSDLPEDESLYVTICATCIQDVLGSPFAGFADDTSWSFTTAAADNTPPGISSLSPADDATDVPLDADLIFTFDEDITFAGTGSDKRVRVFESPGSVAGIYSINDVFSSFSGRTVTIDPPDLDEGTSYYITIDAGYVKDLAGNDFAGISDITTWTFSTIDIDNEAPQVVSLSPGDEDEEQAIDTMLEIAFDEAVQSTGESSLVNIRRQSDNLLLTSVQLSDPIVAEFDGHTLIMTLSDDLPFNTQVYVTVPSNGIEDLEGNHFPGFTDNETWDFGTAEEPDNTPPTAVGLLPANGDDQVSIATNLTITFDEEVLLDNDLGTFELRRKSPDALVETFDIFGPRVTGDNSTMITIDPTNDLEFGVEYYFLIGSDVILDNADNAFAGLLSENDWSFTTELAPDVTPPMLISRSPALNEQGVDIGADLVLTFDEQVQLTGSGTFKLFDRATEQQVGPSFSFPTGAVAAGGEVIYDIPIQLAYGTEYYVEIANAIEDLAGNAFAAITGRDGWFFTTDGELVSPVLTSRTPQNGAVDVAPAIDLMMTFDEPVQLTGAGTFKMFNKANDEQIGVTWSFPPGATVSGNTVTYDIPMDLPLDTEIYFEITNAIEDVWGNAAADIAGNSDWSITTTTEEDTDAPTIVSVDPADDSENVPVDSDFVIAFSEEVQKGTGSISISIYSNNSATQFIEVNSDDVTVSGNTVTIDPPLNLLTDVRFWVRIPATAFEDLAGNSFAGINPDNKDDWDFTTNATAPNPPTVVSLQPQEGAVGVAPDAELSVTFSENIRLGANGATKRLFIQRINGGTGTFQSVDLTSDMITGDQLTVPHNDFEEGVTYQVLINSDVIADLDNNSFLGIAQGEWTFSTPSSEKQGQVITFDAIADKVFRDEPFEVAASASSTLDVALSVVSGPVTILGSTVTINGAGTAVIAANQEGNDDFNPAPEVIQTFTIAKAAQTITIQAIDDKLATDAPFDLVATVDSGLELTYTVEGPATIAGTTITLDGTAGTVTVTVSQAGSDNYAAASESLEFEVTAETILSAPGEVTVQVYPNPTSDLLTIIGPTIVHGRVIDLKGMILQTFSFRTGTINLSGMPIGVYLLELHDATGVRRLRIQKNN